MTKANPLFIDSTKFHGDLVPMQFELHRLLMRDDESLFLLARNEQRVLRRAPMRPLPEQGYEARIHLAHQTLITFQFVLEKAGRPLYRSAPQKARVQYALIAEWQPIDAEACDEIQGDSVMGPQNFASRAESGAWARESSLALRHLIDKWGL